MSKGKSGYLIVTILACLVVGAGIERVRRAVLAPAPLGPQLPEGAPPLRPLQPGRPAAVRAQDPALTTSLEALRLRVADLEAALAERDAELARLRQERPGAAAAPRRFGREEFLQRLEQLKKEKPELFAERERRREEFLQRLDERERAYLLELAAAAAGYEGEDAAGFMESLQQAIQSTSMQGFGPGAPGGPPPGMP